MKRLTFCALAAIVSSSHAFEMPEAKPYYGIDYSIDHAKYDRAKVGIAKMSAYNGIVGINAGVDLNEYFGVEIGFYQMVQTKEKETKIDTSLPVFFGQTSGMPNSEANDAYLSKLRSRGIKLNLTGQYPILENIKLLGMIGVSWENNKITLKQVYDGTPAFGGPLTGRAIQHVYLYGKTKAMLTLSGGIKWDSHRSYGVRAFVTWQNRSNLNDLTGRMSTVRDGRSAFKDSLRYTVGLYTYV